MSVDHFVLKARTGRAFTLPKGSRLSVVNTHGSQVVDTWAFASGDIGEFMSMEHTRVHAPHPTPRVGTVFRTNRRRPILEFAGDSSPHCHDWFFAACDRQRYEMLGFQGVHDNCTDNLFRAMAELGHELKQVPCPLNLFENAPLVSEGTTGIKPPLSRPGDTVELVTLLDVIICLSACPQDMVPTNGADMTPRDVEIRIHSGPTQVGSQAASGMS